jgi:hypothetical protein
MNVAADLETVPDLDELAEFATARLAKYKLPTRAR